MYLSLWSGLGLLATLVSAQSSAGNSSASITVITSLSTSVGLASGRVPTTATVTFLITSTIAPETTPTSNATTTNGSSSAASSTTTANQPTGTATQITDLAPSPGATGGAYGPGDGYINAAQLPQRNGLLAGGLLAAVGLLAL
ncbi:hypothetical protein C8F01DRAFT_408875 [Mycena amicta]|nr:hypothetical protein C8F01DRAFT_408875 [Mycena amicta]